METTHSVMGPNSVGARTKAQLVKRYSNPAIVKNLAKKMLGPDVKVFYSTRKNKKYMVKNPDGKMIHFGAFNPPMEDFTKHQDTQRRDNFRKRNAKWSKQPKWTAGWLAYHLLW